MLILSGRQFEGIMKVQQNLLAVEENILSNFNQYINDLPGSKVVWAIRKKAIEQFLTTRLPSRKIENWHYTNLRTLLKSVSNFSKDQDNQSVDTLLSESAVFP